MLQQYPDLDEKPRSLEEVPGQKKVASGNLEMMKPLSLSPCHSDFDRMTGLCGTGRDWVTESLESVGYGGVFPTDRWS